MPEVLMPTFTSKVKKEKIILVEWLKAEGDQIEEGDLLAVIETNKAAIDIEAEYDGVLVKILVAQGTKAIEAGTPLAILEVAADILEESDADASQLDELELSVEAHAAVNSSKGASSMVPLVSQGVGSVDLKNEDTYSFATPLAQRIAKQQGINLSSISGSGAYGRIVEKDLEGDQHSVSSPSQKMVQIAKNGRLLNGHRSDETTIKHFAPGSYELISHSETQMANVRCLTESNQAVPRIYASANFKLDCLLSLHKRLNALTQKNGDTIPQRQVSVDGFVVKAVATAMNLLPEVNVSWTDEAMIRHKFCDIGFAVSTSGGWINPIVQKANSKGLVEISTEIKDYKKRAYANELKVEGYVAGSAVIPNMSMANISDFAGIVNASQSPTLIIGVSEFQPIVQVDKIVSAQQMTLTLSADHRCIDGALGVEFVGVVKMLLEEPALMLM